jgi:acyl transferase domain-containing protein/acyl carrier protein
LSPADVQYLETHGTGTPLGDAVEIQAVAGSYGRVNKGEPPLMIGSVKTNIGHCEAAAGVAGLIKVILSLQHEVIPPHLHFKKLGQLIRLDSVPAVIATEPLPWKRNPKGPVRYGAVSSFGFSGTNAHVILQESPEALRLEPSRPDAGPCLLTLSAKTPGALSDVIRRYIAFLNTVSAMNLADICHTSHVGRAHFPHRAAFVGGSPADVVRQLEARGANAAAFETTDPPQEKAPTPIAFLFTGPGSEYPGMGRGLYLSEPLFRQHLDDCGQILDRIGHSGLIRRILSTSGPPPFTPPGAAGLFCIQYALARLWQDWGISPAVVMGHSLGEFAAACVAGVFSLEDALILTTAMDHAVTSCPPGAMASVLAGPDRVSPFLEAEGGQIVVAAINSPRNTVIAGPKDAVDRVCNDLNRLNIQTLPISTAGAYHSPLMEPAVAEWKQCTEKIGYTAPRIPVISTRTGCLEDERMADSTYWTASICEQVNFREGLKTLNAIGNAVFLEIGPQPTLLSLARQNQAAAKDLWLPSLRQGMDDRRQMLTSLGRLYELGADIRWEAVDGGRSCKRVSVPTYPFQRQRYWFDPSRQLNRNVMPPQTFLPATTENPSEKMENPVPEHLFYELTWTDCGELQPAVCPESSWLILADRQGMGSRLAQELDAAGCSSVIVNLDAFVPDNEIRYEASSAWIQHLRQGIIDSIGSRKLTHVIYLWALDAPPPDRIDSESLRKSLFQTVFAVPQILEVLTGMVQDCHPRLWLVTCGAMPVDGLQHDGVGTAGERPGLSILQSPLWGIGRTAALEYPHLWGGLIDLDPVSENPDDLQTRADALLAAVLQSGAEDLTAVRRNRIFAARLQRAGSQPVRTLKKNNDPLRFYPDATYLITGGLGALGLQTARWMIGNGACHLALIGRREPSGSVLETLQELRQAGADLYIGSANAADPEAMFRICSEVAAQMPPIKGVVHAAGVLIESPLSEMDAQHAMSVLTPKIQGTWVLDGLMRSFPLDFTVYYSSIAAVWGAKAQGAYSAANQFMDAMAYYQRAAGRKALSVNWGPWSGDGMAGQDSRTWLKRRGLAAIEPQDAFRSLACLLKTDAVQMTVADVDWPVFRRIYQSWGNRPLLDGMDGHGRPNGSRETDPSLPLVGEIRRRLADIPEFDRHAFLVSYLQTRTARVMGMAPETAALNPHQGFFSLGLDSIMAVELRQWMARDLDIDLPMTALFDYPNITKLAVTIEKMIRDTDREPVAIPMTLADPPGLAEVAVLSDMPSAIVDLLSQELFELENLLRS